MCLSIPKKVISVKNGVAAVKSANGQQELGTIIDVKKGDWVLTQNNVIISKINQKEVKEILKIFKK